MWTFPFLKKSLTKGGCFAGEKWLWKKEASALKRIRERRVNGGFLSVVKLPRKMCVHDKALLELRACCLSFRTRKGRCGN